MRALTPPGITADAAPLNSALLIFQTPVSSFSAEDTTSTVSPTTASFSSCPQKKEKLFNADSLHQRTLSPTLCHPSPMSSGREWSVAAGSRASEVIPFKELCQIFNLVLPEGSKVTSIQYWLSSLILLRRQYRPNLSNLLISGPQMVKYPHFFASGFVFFFGVSFLDWDKVVTFSQSPAVNSRPLLKIALSRLAFMRAPVTVNGGRFARGPSVGLNIHRADELHQALKLPLLNQMSNGGDDGESKEKTFFTFFFLCVAIYL